MEKFATSKFLKTFANKILSKISVVGLTGEFKDLKDSPIAPGSNSSSIIIGSNTNVASGEASVATGTGSRAIGADSVATGLRAITRGTQSHAEGSMTEASGADGSHAEGYITIASGRYGSHAEGRQTVASGQYSHAEGKDSNAIGNGAHAEGISTLASGLQSHAEGTSTIASGSSSHAEGQKTTASGNNGSHAEGWANEANGKASHVEGHANIAEGDYSHAEGYKTTAWGYQAHAEGYGTYANGNSSHAEGGGAWALGVRSHAQGYETRANSDNQHAAGKYNIVDESDTYAEIIGNGTADNARSNARTLDWEGNAWHAGDVIATETITDGDNVGTISHHLIAKADAADLAGIESDISDLDTDVTNIKPRVAYYGTCDTAYNVAEKVVTLQNGISDFTLTTGTMLFVRFVNYNSANYPTLSITNAPNATDKVAKYIYRGNNYLPGSNQYIYSNTVYLFVYNGNQWEYIGAPWNTNFNNTDTYNRLLWGDGYLKTAVTNYTRLIGMAGDLSGYTPVRNSNTTDIEINLNYPLYYVITTLSAGNSYLYSYTYPIYTNNYLYYYVDNTYWGRTFTGSTTNKSQAVYLYGTLDNTNTKFTVKGVSPQPVTADNYIYLYIGVTRNFTSGSNPSIDFDGLSRKLYHFKGNDFVPYGVSGGSDDLITISSTEPTSDDCKIWIKI